MRRLGSERRVEPGTENKFKVAVPGPTKYQLPSLVREIIKSSSVIDSRGSQDLIESKNRGSWK